ncbi:MAG: hypothetical protein ACXVX7_04145, partial [Mycobacterium sp.]
GLAVREGILHGLERQCGTGLMGPEALVHPSVLVRRRDHPGYLPNLTDVEQRLSADRTDWTSPAM